MNKALQGEKLGQSQRVVRFSGVAVTVFSTLPKLPAVGAAGKHGAILLALMPENRVFLAFQVARTKRYDPLDLVRLPFFPGAAVKPDFKALTVGSRTNDRLEDRVGAHAV